MRASRWIASRYNFAVPVEQGALLYNASTGAVVKLLGGDGLRLATQLCRGRFPVRERAIPDPVLVDLKRARMIVPAGSDELQEIRERYWRARGETPIALTITTTMDCNLGCYYCYEERSPARLEAADVPAVVALARARLAESGKRSLHVDWYGGEPLLNAGFLEQASGALQALCAELEVRYSASIISNGTAWPEDAAGFVRRHRIHRVQISFDGLKRNHDRRRRYRDRRESEGGQSSAFERAVSLVERLLDVVHVDVRLNIDRGNRGDVLPFIRFARRHGWFARAYPAVVQPARISAYSERSAFVRRSELALEEYDALRAQIRAELAAGELLEESEAPDGFPYPKTSVCAALAADSVVVGADRSLYRCGLQVSETHRAVGKLGGSGPRIIPLVAAGQAPRRAESDAGWWDEFDPTRAERCSRCSFLPVCWGGCPKKHLERDTHALVEQGSFWRANLARLITARLDERPPAGFGYSEADQFRP